MEHFKEGNGKKNEVLTTIVSQVLPLATIAAQWEGAEKSFSVTEWLKDEGSVLILGADPAYPEFLKKN